MKTGKIIFVLALLICLGCGAVLGYRFVSSENQKTKEDQLKKEVEGDTRSKVSLEEIESQEFVGERDGETSKIPEDIFTKDSDKKIDFDKLHAYNEELVAWIYVQGTKIDYPIARRDKGDQEFYLNNDMYGEPSYSGCIYMENRNKGDFTDRNTVIYGHNMKNGTMFKGLHLFEEEDFFNENRYIYIYLPDKTLVYEIFAAYTTDDTHILSAYDFDKDEEYQNYLDDVTDPHYMGAFVRENCKVTIDDKIITLSTCVGGSPENRYLVQGVLRYDKEVGRSGNGEGEQ